MPTPSGGWLVVIAVEPSYGMREEADRRRSSDRVRWLSDTPPSLEASRGARAGDCQARHGLLNRLDRVR